MDGTLAAADLERLRKDFSANPAYRLAQNAVTRVTVDDVAINREIVSSIDHSLSTTLDDWKVTNQEKSGRCWLFAGLNLLRVGVMRKTGLKDFEFSQNYAMFWDKLERANYFLEAIIETADRDLDDRTVAFLLESVAGDGGQWNMFAALVAKHGLVPKGFMPETQSSSNTARMNSILRYQLRQGARTVRAAAADGAEAARAAKAEIMQVVYRILCIHLGTPPERFDWQWTDKDKKFHRDGVLTPQEFAAKYVDLPVSDYVCLVNDPRPSSPIGRTFTVEYLGNVIGGPPVIYLNVDMQVIKDVAAATIQGGEPVWFGCDVGKMMSNDYAFWDAELYDLPVGLRHRVRPRQGRPPGLPRDRDDARDALHRGRRAGRRDPALARGEQLGLRPRQGRLLHDERLLVRPVRLRDRRPQERASGRPAEAPWTPSRSCCPPGTRWAPWPGSQASALS